MTNEEEKIKMEFEKLLKEIGNLDIAIISNPELIYVWKIIQQNRLPGAEEWEFIKAFWEGLI